MTRKAFGVETAFEVLSGEGGRLISLNAEYDALPDVGHACGHHLIAAASISAFLAMTEALKSNGLPGRVQLLGTPAEESGGGKISLLNAGAYNGVDAALMRSVRTFLLGLHADVFQSSRTTINDWVRPNFDRPWGHEISSLRALDH